jgi:hypothetical protein
MMGACGQRWQLSGSSIELRLCSGRSAAADAAGTVQRYQQLQERIGWATEACIIMKSEAMQFSCHRCMSFATKAAADTREVDPCGQDDGQVTSMYCVQK